MNIESQYNNPMLNLIVKKMEELGLKKQVDLIKLSGVPQSSISKLFGKSKQISLNNIFKILVSLDLLKTCENDYNPGIPINLEYLQAIIEMLERIIEEEKINMPPDIKANLIKLYYQLSIKNNRLIDYEFIKENSKLMYRI